MRIVLTLLAFTALPALAQPACPPADPLTAATAADGTATVHSGQAVRLGLHPVSQVHFTVPPHRAGDAKSHGGLVTFTVPATGTWRVGLGSGAWIEVVQDGRTVTSSAHHHGESCIIKMVDFPLHAGSAGLELSASDDPEIRLQVSPAD